MRASLGVGISLDTNRLAGALAGPSVRLCPLPANRKASKMADSPVGLDSLKPL